MKNQDFFWIYPARHQEQALNGACSWCTQESDKLKRHKTSDGDTLSLCPDCVLLGRRVSVGGFAVPRIAIPMIKEKRKG